MHLQDPPRRKPVARVNPPAEADSENGEPSVADEPPVVAAVAVETVTVEILSVTTEVASVSDPSVAPTVCDAANAEDPRGDDVDKASLT